MSKKKVLLSLLVTIALLFSLSAVATADAPINTEEMILPTDLNPYEYGSAPDGLYVFLYHGTAPYFDMDIETSECVVDRLYVYDSILDVVTEISDAAVTAYTATKDALYYITQAQTLYATDYTGQHQEQLYICNQGVMKGLSSYLNTLYFIENDSAVIYFDTITKQSQVVLQIENLEWVFLLSETEFVAATTEEDYFLCNLLAKETIAISEVEATNRANVAVLRWANSNEADVSVMARYDSSSVTQANDVSLPLTEYPVTETDNNDAQGFNHPTPTSWFHVNASEEGCSSTKCKKYNGSGECLGFAWYVHDVYMHTVNNNTDYDSWIIENQTHNDDNETHNDDNETHNDYYDFNASDAIVKDFFNQLNTGAYVRYRKESSYHSFVFVSRDTWGVWIYECNQRYRYDIPKETALRDYGCGVHLQYYTYVFIADKYLGVQEYVNHTFAQTSVCENGLMHKTMCTSCDGYVRERHVNSGVTYSPYSSTQHKVDFACCDGVAYQNHTYSNNQCTKCGRYDYGLGELASLGKEPAMLENSVL